MRSKISLKWLLIIVGIVAITVSSVAIFFPDQDSFTQSASLINNQTPQDLVDGESVELPIRLKIPRINVDAAVKYVGVTPQGAMDAPKSPTEVAWFSLGPRPGEEGSAVIAGHEGWKNSIPAVFDDLHKLQKGDKLYVEDEKGMVAVFVVRELRIYDQNGDTSGVFGSSDGKVHLNLITCQGVWNKNQKSYSHRLVVFTDKETE